MKTIYDVRRQNARNLAETVGGVSGLAIKIDRAQTQVSRLIGYKRTSGRNQNIGDGVARHIEECFEKPVGWLDVQHEEDASGLAESISNASHNPNAGKAPLVSWDQIYSGSDIQAEGVDSSKVDNWLQMPPRAGARTFVLKVPGESMLPEYTSSHLIFIDPDRRVKSGDDVVVYVAEKGEAMLRRYIEEPGSGKMLKALNPAFGAQYEQLKEEDRVIGVVTADMRLR